jgi:hypothetical protein
MDNGQVRTLTCHGGEAEFGDCTQTDLTEAKHNLETYFAVVGISERFDETLVLMKRELGWPGYPLFRKANVTRDRPSLDGVSHAAMKAIEKYNSLDCELFEWAKNRFEERLASQRAAVQKQLFFMSAVNAAYQRPAQVLSQLVGTLKRFERA